MTVVPLMIHVMDPLLQGETITSDIDCSQEVRQQTMTSLIKSLPPWRVRKSVLATNLLIICWLNSLLSLPLSLSLSVSLSPPPPPTHAAPSPPSSSSSLPVIIAAVIVILVVVVIVIVVVIVVVLFMRKRKRQGDFNLKM